MRVGAGAGSIPGQGSKIPHAFQCGQKKKNFFFLKHSIYNKKEEQNRSLKSVRTTGETLSETLQDSTEMMP